MGTPGAGAHANGRTRTEMTTEARRGRAGAPFVGREREMEELLDALDGAIGGDGRLVMLAGEPGIGKSRLADELSLQAHALGAQVVWGRCWEAGGAPPYWPWVQSLRGLLRQADPDDVRQWVGSGGGDLVTILPEFAEILPRLPDRPEVLDPDTARFRLFESIAGFLRASAGGRPLVVVLDDLHAADTPSLLLLRFIVPQLAGTRLLIVAAYRDVDPLVHGDLGRTITNAIRVPRTRTITLAGLDETDVETFIREATGVTAPRSVVAAVHRETEGNPLFVGEIAKLLAHEGALSSPTQLQRVAIPQSVREVIGRRLEHLADPCRRILVLASVIGRQFDLDTLSRISERSVEDLLDVLSEAIEVKVLTETPGPYRGLRFAHTLIRDTLYEEMPPMRRARLHRGIAEALEELHAHDIEPFLATLAYHYVQAGTAGAPALAVEFAQRAGRRALVLLAYEEAVRWFLEALAVPDRNRDLVRRCELLLELGDAQTRVGDRDGSKQSFRAAADLARSLGSSAQLARAALGYGGLFVWSASRDDPNLVRLLEEAIQAIGPHDDPLRVRLLARLAGGPLRDDPDVQRRRRLGIEAVEMAERLGDQAALAYALDGRGWAILFAAEDIDTRLGVAQRLVDTAQRLGDPERAMDGHGYRCLCRWEAGDGADARLQLEIVSRLAQQLRQPTQIWFAAAMKALVALFEGRFDVAEELIGHGRDVAERAEPYHATSSYAIQLLWLRMEQGRLDEVRDELVSVAAEYANYPLWSCLLPFFQLHLGMLDEAAAGFDRRAADGFVSLPQNETWLVGLSVLGEVGSQVGSEAEAAVLYDLLLPYRDRVAITYCEISYGSVALALGLLANRLGRSEEALDHLRRAVEVNQRMGGRPAANRARQALAGGYPDGWITTPKGGAAATGHEARGTLRRDGEYWTLALDRESAMLKDSKGLRYLAVLLGRPGHEVHAMDLVRGGERGRPRHPPPAGDAGEMLDEQAKREYHRRVQELRGEIDEAQAWNDPEREARVRAELDFINRELARAVGLGGRDRRAVSDAERARVNVTRAIKATLDRIEAACPQTAAHLRAAVRTGTFCVYEPDPRLRLSWTV
jgi:tetratricopeptide (TPR) repeat protein